MAGLNKYWAHVTITAESPSPLNEAYMQSAHDVGLNGTVNAEKKRLKKKVYKSFFSGRLNSRLELNKAINWVPDVLLAEGMKVLMNVFEYDGQQYTRNTYHYRMKNSKVTKREEDTPIKGMPKYFVWGAQNEV